jgi:Flp pilus assembly pilin Flp
MADETPSNLFSDRRGAASTEYVALLGTVGIVIAIAIIGWGPPLVTAYERTRAVLISPTP